MTAKITKVIHPLLQLSSKITSPVLDDAPSYVAHQNPWRPSPDTPEEVAEDGGVSQLKLPWSLSVTQSWRECFCLSWWLMTLTSTCSSFPRWNAFSFFTLKLHSVNTFDPRFAACLPMFHQHLQLGHFLIVLKKKTRKMDGALEA